MTHVVLILISYYLGLFIDIDIILVKQKPEKYLSIHRNLG